MRLRAAIAFAFILSGAAPLGAEACGTDPAEILPPAGGASHEDHEHSHAAGDIHGSAAHAGVPGPSSHEHPDDHGSSCCRIDAGSQSVLLGSQTPAPRVQWVSIAVDPAPGVGWQSPGIERSRARWLEPPPPDPYAKTRRPLLT